MKPFSVHPIVKEGFSLSARHESNAIILKISGNGDMETPTTLGGYLKKVHTEALRLRAHSVIVECDELYFMRSACIKCLVTWIDNIAKLELTERYKVKLYPNTNLPWQRRSFEALRRFAPALVHVESDSTSHTKAASPSGTVAQSPSTGSTPRTPVATPAGATPPSSSLGSTPRTPVARPSGTLPQPSSLGSTPRTPAATPSRPVPPLSPVGNSSAPNALPLRRKR